MKRIADDEAHDDAPEPQQTLFSLTEFIAKEPVNPNRRGHKLHPATASPLEPASGTRLPSRRTRNPGCHE